MNETPPSEPRPELGTVDKVTRFASEDLARNLNRRSFLRRAGAGAFGFMITVATGRLLTPRAASASGVGPQPAQPLAPNCSPPGPYCNYKGEYPGTPDACRGAHCWQHMVSGQIYQCHVYYQYYPSGCWTSSGSGGYWTCCDCRCDNGSTCGCAQFSGTPAPAPSKPVG